MTWKNSLLNHTILNSLVLVSTSPSNGKYSPSSALCKFYACWISPRSDWTKIGNLWRWDHILWVLGLLWFSSEYLLHVWRGRSSWHSRQRTVRVILESGRWLFGAKGWNNHSSASDVHERFNTQFSRSFPCSCVDCELATAAPNVPLTTDISRIYTDNI